MPKSKESSRKSPVKEDKKDYYKTKGAYLKRYAPFFVEMPRVELGSGKKTTKASTYLVGY